MNNSVRCAIAIPACNEAALLPRCLDALAAQTVERQNFMVVVYANNCADDTVSVARHHQSVMPLQIVETHFAPDAAHAGSARRGAVEAAATYSDIVLTTDADCMADADWVETMLAAFSHGVDVVAGRVSGDWAELQQLPKAALAIGALEWEYLSLIGEAEALFDPQPHDPAPRHAQCCGANIGITRDMLNRVGGVPAIPTGEDRALIAAVETLGGKVRHDPKPHVTASARLAGRATGGMADALACRDTENYVCDAQFQSADDLVRRLKCQYAARSLGHFTQYVADSKPQRRRLKPAQLPHEIDRLRALMQVAHGQ